MNASRCIVWISLALCIITVTTAPASEPTDPESAIRRLVRANAEKDLPTLSHMMAHDADIISYGVAGRKYIGWPELEQGMKEEFLNAQKLEIPIKELKVWTKGDLAWYAMEVDYVERGVIHECRSMSCPDKPGTRHHGHNRRGRTVRP
ncbi:MAG: SnoaL-like domain-containing protein [Nitrospira sp.]|nr:SnoaL-like domain-containing protein [Nitrospira sp.]